MGTDFRCKAVWTPLFWTALIALLLAPTDLAAQGQKIKQPKTPTWVQGVETTIPSHFESSETYDKHDIVAIVSQTDKNKLDWTPKTAPVTKTLLWKSKNVLFTRPVWNLEYTFKPLRLIWVDIPDKSGKLVQKPIWYMVYRVKNKGGHFLPVLQPDKTYKIEKVDNLKQSIRFFPVFVLQGLDVAGTKGIRSQVVPAALGPIQKRELKLDPNKEVFLRNDIQISQRSIPLSTDTQDNSLWGVVTWENVDPKIDYLSVYIQGLTSAYRWREKEGADPPGSERIYKTRMLKLNFWRPGDRFAQNEEEIRYGIPPKNLRPKVAGGDEEIEIDSRNHRWVWRDRFGSNSQ